MKISDLHLMTYLRENQSFQNTGYISNEIV
jgi:hypothetical protein